MSQEIEVRKTAMEIASIFCKDINSLLIYGQAIAEYILTGSDPLTSKEQVLN